MYIINTNQPAQRIIDWIYRVLFVRFRFRMRTYSATVPGGAGLIIVALQAIFYLAHVHPPYTPMVTNRLIPDNPLGSPLNVPSGAMLNVALVFVGLPQDALL